MTMMMTMDERQAGNKNFDLIIAIQNTIMGIHEEPHKGVPSFRPQFSSGMAKETGIR